MSCQAKRITLKTRAVRVYHSACIGSRPFFPRGGLLPSCLVCINMSMRFLFFFVHMVAQGLGPTQLPQYLLLQLVWRTLRLPMRVYCNALHGWSAK